MLPLLLLDAIFVVVDVVVLIYCLVVGAASVAVGVSHGFWLVFMVFKVVSWFFMVFGVGGYRLGGWSRDNDKTNLSLRSAWQLIHFQLKLLLSSPNGFAQI